jgi:signal peptidase I
MELADRTLRWPWFVVIAAEVLSWLCLQPFSVPTGGMEDTILNGDQIFVEKVSRRLGRLPARLRIRDKQLYLNGSPVSQLPRTFPVRLVFTRPERRC